MPRLSRRSLSVLALAGLSPWATSVSGQDKFNPDELRFSALRPKRPGELNVGVLVDFPPYGLLGRDGQPDGYDADVARLLSNRWRVPVNLIPVSGGSRIPFLLSGKVDLLVASLAITPEREKQVSFSAPYSAATLVIFGAKSVTLQTLADLKPYRIGVAKASTQDAALTALAPAGTKLMRLYDDASATQALVAGRVDAIGCSTTVAARIAERAPAGAFEQKFVLRQQMMGIAARPGDAALQKRVDEFVAQSRADGSLGKLYRKWLGVELPGP